MRTSIILGLAALATLTLVLVTTYSGNSARRPYKTARESSAKFPLLLLAALILIMAFVVCCLLMCSRGSSKSKKTSLTKSGSKVISTNVSKKNVKGAYHGSKSVRGTGKVVRARRGSKNYRGKNVILRTPEHVRGSLKGPRTSGRRSAGARVHFERTQRLTPPPLPPPLWSPSCSGVSI